MSYFSSWLYAFVDLKKCICGTSEVGCLCEFILSVLFCGSLFLPCCFCEAGFYRYSAVAYCNSPIFSLFYFSIICVCLFMLVCDYLSLSVNSWV